MCYELIIIIIMISTSLEDSRLSHARQEANSKHLKEPSQNEEEHDRQCDLHTPPTHEATEDSLVDNLDSWAAVAE